MSFSCKYIIFFLILILFSCNKKPRVKFTVFSHKGNLAYNDGGSIFPSPLESEKGWGGPPFKWQLVDGIRTKTNYWQYGLAFTGGLYEYIDTCGWRQATIDFGKPVSFNRVVIWLNKAGMNLMPDSFKIMHWNEQKNEWQVTKDVKNKIKQVELYYPLFMTQCEKLKVDPVCPYEETFSTVKSSKVRFIFNNCGIDHGWINEFEVYNDTLAEQRKNLEVQF
jgi:hypothetical protein